MSKRSGHHQSNTKGCQIQTHYLGLLSDTKMHPGNLYFRINRRSAETTNEYSEMVVISSKMIVDTEHKHRLLAPTPKPISHYVAPEGSFPGGDLGQNNITLTR